MCSSWDYGDYGKIMGQNGYIKYPIEAMAIEIVSCPIHSTVDLSMVMLARLPEANIGLCSGLRGIELSNNMDI
jgi:hypothetical protein